MQNLELGGKYASANQQKEQAFQLLKESYKNDTQKFEDWEFPPGMDSLGDIEFLNDHPNARIFWKRPHELVREWNKDPKAKPHFISPQGVGRFDISQGGLGDCWYLSGLAELATEDKLFRVVVPEDNLIGFDDGEYSGAFHFRYWRAGVWTEVVIDDRLPCVKNAKGVTTLVGSEVKNNEFWTVLAEKAYAKLYGSYQQIEGGFQSEALEDFTGGISISDNWNDDTDLDELTETLKDKLRRARKRRALIGFGSKCADETTEEEEGAKVSGHTESTSLEGIAKGHAYSVTGIEEVVDNKGESHFLIRLRNPWGCYEWSGKWSDSDNKSWATVPKDLRVRGTGGAKKLGGGCDDGEFFISLEDLVRKFDMMSICYWSPLAYEGHLSQSEMDHVSWDMKMLRGSWSNTVEMDPYSIKADLVKLQNVTVNFSRCKNSSDPLLEKGDSSQCTVVVALIYELYNHSGTDESMPNIGFRIFEVPENRGKKPYDVKFFETATEITEEIPMSDNTREINKLFQLEERKLYCIVPFADSPEVAQPGCDVKLPYLLRIFSEMKISIVQLN